MSGLGAWVYVMTNRPHGTLYIGVTRNLNRRIWEHRESVIEGFTTRYHLTRLVHVEFHEELVAAIRREKTLKLWLRAWKVRLIEAGNPEWTDLYDQIS